VNRRGGSVILHYRQVRPVLVRDWSPRMDGITATIFASQTTRIGPGWRLSLQAQASHRLKRQPFTATPSQALRNLSRHARDGRVVSDHQGGSRRQPARFISRCGAS
jgi:hypothetical protein